MISQGEARRIEPADDSTLISIPLASRDELLGSVPLVKLGVELLRGVVRLRDNSSPINLKERPAVQHWIDVIPEKRGVTPSQPTEVSIDSPGVYRQFNTSTKKIPEGTRLNSYLFHFRPTNTETVHGVVRFSQPIIGIICATDSLEATDQSLGLSSMNYKLNAGQWRGLESIGNEPLYGDEITLSQDLRTLSLRVNANIHGGVDQVRVLTLSEEDNP